MSIRFVFQLFVLGSLLLGGCALSPQTVMLTPLVDVAVPVSGQGRTLRLQVEDIDPDSALGVRGGIYPTATVRPASPVDNAVRRALSERLSSAGFRIVDTDHPIGLTVTVVELSYRSVPIGTAASVNDIVVQAILDAEAYNPNRRYGARYRHHRTERVLGYPSATANETLINAVLSETLRQLLQDRALLQLLTDPA